MTNEAESRFEALKARMKATWIAGDFGEIARFSEGGAEEFIARRNVKVGVNLLDVASGTGNLAIPAAKAGATVTGIDIAPNLVAQAHERAEQMDVQVQFDEGDAEALPYPHAAFEVVVSMFGAMFAPRADRVAAELTRGCRSGGQIAMANWTPRGFIGRLFKLTSVHVPPPPNIPPPVLWGDEGTVRQRLSAGISELRMTPVMLQLKPPFSVSETVEFYRKYYGPTQKAFDALAADRQPAFRRDLEDFWAQHNKATDGTVDVDAEYLEVVALRS
jgi:ubiquinone/menaquinone biosynthesis C-methylase UbiE